MYPFDGDLEADHTKHCNPGRAGQRASVKLIRLNCRLLYCLSTLLQSLATWYRPRDIQP